MMAGGSNLPGADLDRRSRSCASAGDSVPTVGVPDPSVELYWIPLGAGTPVVQWNGRVYEALASRIQRRPACDLYHSSLIVTVDDGRYTIEMTPIPDSNGTARGVVAEGPVGLRWLARLRIFRYEIRRWNDGTIPDLAWAIDSPRVLSNDAGTAYRILSLVPQVPTPVWGRDELHTGGMWNSNSVVSWLLERGGVDVASVAPPANGRAPGWDAGVVIARRTRSVPQLPGCWPCRVALTRLAAVSTDRCLETDGQDISSCSAIASAGRWSSRSNFRICRR